MFNKFFAKLAERYEFDDILLPIIKRFVSLVSLVALGTSIYLVLKYFIGMKVQLWVLVGSASLFIILILIILFRDSFENFFEGIMLVVDNKFYSQPIIVRSNPNDPQQKTFIEFYEDGVTVEDKSAGFYRLTAKRILLRIWKRRSKLLLQYPKLSIVAILQERRSFSTLLSMLFISLGYIIYSVLNSSIGGTSSQLVNYIFIGGLILLGANKYIFDYRVSSGLYGNNEREAREIIHFITQESSNIDFTDNGKPKKIISESDLKELEQIFTGSKPIPQGGIS